MTTALHMCPICKTTPVSTETGVRPFCSVACKDVDLSRWLNGNYRIAGAPVDPSQLTMTNDKGIAEASDGDDSDIE